MHVTKELIDNCQADNRKAQKDLYKILLPYLRAITVRYIRDGSYVKDVLQESFIKLFKNLDRYDANKAPINKWSARIVINECINYNKRLIKISNEEFDSNKHEIICLPQILSDISNADMLSILKQMPDSYFEVFNLFVIDGYNHKEISQLLEIGTSLSRKRLARARAWIKKTFRVTDDEEIELSSIKEKIKN